MKRCSKCKQFLPEDKFHKDSCRKDGLKCYCKACCAIIHKEKYRYSTLTDEQKRIRSLRVKEWQAKNKDACRRIYKKYYNTDKGQLESLKRRLKQAKKEKTKIKLIEEIKKYQTTQQANLNDNLITNDMEILKFERGQRVKQYDDDIEDWAFGVVTEVGNFAIFIKWDDIEGSCEHKKNEWDSIMVI
jgi:uncharacterized protein YegJ (DUF2314 family)